MNIKSLDHLNQHSPPHSRTDTRHTGVKVLINLASSSVSFEKVCGALVGTTTKSPSLASTILGSSPGASGTWNRTVPLVTRKVSSCISCQCAGGPGVLGGIISSTVEMRLSGIYVRCCHGMSGSEVGWRRSVVWSIGDTCCQWDIFSLER